MPAITANQPLFGIDIRNGHVTRNRLVAETDHYLCCRFSSGEVPILLLSVEVVGPAKDGIERFAMFARAIAISTTLLGLAVGRAKSELEMDEVDNEEPDVEKGSHVGDFDSQHRMDDFTDGSHHRMGERSSIEG